MHEGYQALRVAILRQAIKDYKRALKQKNAGQIKRLERFFLSEWGELLSNNNGDVIIKNCKEKIK